MKKLVVALVSVLIAFGLQGNVKAAEQSLSTNTINYVVQSGDSMWKICNKFQVGVPEVIALNPQISNPNIINPGNILKIPNIDATKAIENEVIRLVNVERTKIGLPALKANWQICRVARFKAEDMINKNYFSHTSPTYGSPFDMMKNFGINFSAAGENIAQGQQTPAEVMKSWMNSTGHRQNILNTRYTEIGVGIAKSSNGSITWVQQFIQR